MSAPFPEELLASRSGAKLAWVDDARGARNVWVAEPPDYRGRQLTHYTADDGQGIAGLEWTADARRSSTSAAAPPTGRGTSRIRPAIRPAPSRRSGGSGSTAARR